MSRQEIRAELGIKDEKHFREFYQQPAVARGLIEMTFPEKPTSRLQKYRLGQRPCDDDKAEAGKRGTMNAIGEREIFAQQRVVEFFRDALGYAYLGNWTSRPDNSNVERERLSAWLKGQGHNDRIIDKALHELGKAVALGGGRTLYDANKEVYGLLRYGVKVQPDVGEQHVTVWLIDWENPSNNDFAVAEEVTVSGENTKRSDIVLHVNGIALGVLELKRSIVSVAEGIRQNLDNQKREFIQPFFSTAQLVMAGNETEGLRYSVIETPEKYWLRWKDAETFSESVDNILLRELRQLCNKERLLEIIHDFIVFDSGIKKICRHNQYFGVKAAQGGVKRREGGIVWHTQGSGKSLTMVWLAKWIRENITDSRVLLLTDRTELDEQIKETFEGVSEKIHRTKSGADLVDVLNTSEKWLICSLIQKFEASEEDDGEGDIDAFIKDIRSHLPKGFYPKGEVFVFVDECHRTQSGKLHDAMKSLLPGAMLVGFTGTPLLKQDKRRSIEIFGPYIHTYKYDEAVRDGAVLDLRYEARDIDQNITSQSRIDQWFELKTRGLIDMKMYEPAMRHLLDTYIRAEESVPVSALDDLTLVELIVERGEAAVDSLPEGIRSQPEATAETIENNVRRLIIDQAAVNPRYYERMSKLLDTLILQRKQEALEYKTYLAGIVELTREIAQPKTTLYPPTINSPARQALYDNLKEHTQRLAALTLGKQVADTSDDVAEAIALKLDDAVRAVKKADWRGNRFKEREVRNVIRSALGDDEELVKTFFEIVKARRDY